MLFERSDGCNWRHVVNHEGAHIHIAVRLSKVFDLRIKYFFYLLLNAFT